MNKTSTSVIPKLPGATNLKARKLYYNLKKHYQDGTCSTCTFYQRYGVMILSGDVFEHLQDINDGILASSDLFKLKDANLIELEQISARQYRLTMCELVPQEQVG